MFLKKISVLPILILLICGCTSNSTQTMTTQLIDGDPYLVMELIEINPLVINDECEEVIIKVKAKNLAKTPIHYSEIINGDYGFYFKYSNIMGLYTITAEYESDIITLVDDFGTISPGEEVIITIHPRTGLYWDEDTSISINGFKSIAEELGNGESEMELYFFKYDPINGYYLPQGSMNFTINLNFNWDVEVCWSNLI